MTLTSPPALHQSLLFGSQTGPWSNAGEKTMPSTYEKLDEGIRAGKLRVTLGEESHGDLANVIVEAWSNPDFKKRLLTIPSGSPKDYRISGADRTRTKNALEEMGIILDEPIVLTVKQFATYKMTSKTEVVLPLPEPRGKKTRADALKKMEEHALGV
jgi:hypothetical protein